MWIHINQLRICNAGLETHVRCLFFRNWTVPWSKITKKRDEQTERRNREIIERTEKDRPDISWSLSCQPIHYSSRAAYKCATHVGVSLIRFMCLSSDVDLSDTFRYRKHVSAYRKRYSWISSNVELQLSFKKFIEYSSYRNMQ